MNKLIKLSALFVIPYLVFGVASLGMIPSADAKTSISCTIIEINPPILPEGEHGTVVLNCDGDTLDKMKVGDMIIFNKHQKKKKKVIEGC
jgi:hypothetical protein